MTAFRPFTVRELDFEVWDVSQARAENIMAQYEELGIIAGSRAPEPPKPEAMNAPPLAGGGMTATMPSWDLGDSLNQRFTAAK